MAAEQTAARPAEPTRTRYQVQGVHCSGCVEWIEEGLSHLPGARHVEAGTSGQVSVDATVPPAAVREALHKLGFPMTSELGPLPGKEVSGDAGKQTAGSIDDPRVDRAPAPWFDQPGDAGTPSWWVRHRDWLWSAVIVAVVVGLGAWDVITQGPIHPHV